MLALVYDDENDDNDDGDDGDDNDESIYLFVNAARNPLTE